MTYLEKLYQLRSRREMMPSTISEATLTKAIDHVRLAACGKNLQQLRYVLVNDEQVNDIFNLTNLPTAHKIADNQKPAAFIVMGSLEDIKGNTLFGIDEGIASQVIREYLFDEGYASLCIYSFNRLILKELLGINNFYPDLLIAIGKSEQIVNIEDSDEEVANYRNENNEHTVRKLTSEKLILKR